MIVTLFLHKTNKEIIRISDIELFENVVHVTYS